MSDEPHSKRTSAPDWPADVVGREVADTARGLGFTLAFDQIAKESVAGDVAQVGVDRGQAAYELASSARSLGRHTYLFDPFSGLDAGDLDDNAPAGFDDTTLQAVRQFVGTDQTTYCQGAFPTTTEQVPPETMFCLVHLACEPYAQMLSALEFFYPRMSSGGFILVHDYSAMAGDGAERAADAFFANKPEQVVPLPDGYGTAVVRRQRGVAGHTWQDRLAAAAFQPGWLESSSQVSDLLFVEGWSIAEEWGRWGIGEAHTLRLRAPPYVEGDILLEVDAETVILASQTAQDVAVLRGDQLLATWHFDAAANRAVRAVRIPAASWSQGTAIDLIFRPRSCRSPVELTQGDADPDQDDRSLGMAVHRLRARAEAMRAEPTAGSVVTQPLAKLAQTERVQTASTKGLRLSWPWVSTALLCLVLGAAALSLLEGGFLQPRPQSPSGYATMRLKQAAAWMDVERPSPAAGASPNSVAPAVAPAQPTPAEHASVTAPLMAVSEPRLPPPSPLTPSVPKLAEKSAMQITAPAAVVLATGPAAPPPALPFENAAPLPASANAASAAIFATVPARGEPAALAAPPRPASKALVAALDVPKPAPLPAAALTMVTIRFLKGDPHAAQQASDLADGLRADGFLVGPPVATLAHENTGTRFVFAQDHDAATRVAVVAHQRIADLPTTAMQEKPAAGDPLSPGGVGIMLSGKPATAW